SSLLTAGDKALQCRSAEVVGGKPMLLVASRGCWWRAGVFGGGRGCWGWAGVVGGKPRLLVASSGCWWEAEVVGGKQRLLVASSGCWWQAEIVESSFEEENNVV